MQDRVSPGRKLTNVRIRWTSMKFSSRAWKNRFRPAGTLKRADPSAWTGTMPCSTATQMWALQVTARCPPKPSALRSSPRFWSTSADHGFGICSITRMYFTVPGGTPSSPR